ncbi:hypothetical protein ACDY96_26600 [Rhizobium mongolense]|uniref:hypothetical protein n=1 Tax=Rhizobium TaxID=379 RepID=UPI0024B1CFEA|nr:hypothetical protein [Rhizobium sp. CC1099]WFU86087.1 hypothetical protein QA644_13075 [Rhizobium sp. CC1099]
MAAIKRDYGEAHSGRRSGFFIFASSSALAQSGNPTRPHGFDQPLALRFVESGNIEKSLDGQIGETA